MENEEKIRVEFEKTKQSMQKWIDYHCDRADKAEAALATRPDVNQELIRDIINVLEPFKYIAARIPTTATESSYFERGLCLEKKVVVDIQRMLNKLYGYEGDIAKQALAKHKSNNLTIKDLAGHKFNTSEYISFNDGISRVYNPHKSGDARFTEEELINTISTAIKESAINEDYKNPDWLEIRSKAIITALKQCGALKVKGE